KIAAVLLFAMASGCQDRAHAEDGDWLRQQIDRAKNGATIEVPAGRYDISDVYISKDITIIGPEDRSAVLQSASVTDKGILVPTEGTSLRVENLTLLGAHSWDRNGAGVRFEGRTLEIVNCLFDGNEDGILFTGDDNGSLKVIGSEFRNSGFGDGYSHGIYVDGAALVQVEDTKFVGTRIGHHIKSASQKTVVVNSYFDDAFGRSSYTIDMPAGGEVIIRGNTVIQGEDAENATIFNYDLGKGGRPVSLLIEDNEIINEYSGGRLLRNDTRAPVTLQRNDIENRGKRPLKVD
ncbi:MAG: right-handed parallel beta-helix repeat-containing protein, partial [Pseudomonadota bacterium]